jgi:two-component sensor histidine kinase
MLASQAAVILANHRLYQQMESALARQRELLAQREALFSVNARIYQEASLDELLVRLADLTPSALGVDLCVVLLSADRPGYVKVAAITRSAPPEALKHVGDIVPMVANTQSVMESGELLVSPDARSDTGCSRQMCEVMGAASTAYVPLPTREGRPMGVLVALRRKPGEFAAEQLETARLFAARAGAAIENARLYERARDDAQMRAMLLRELNHRVKNNLSAIVALLSISEADMPPDGRQWLSRVIERIRTMARTHELFVAGAKTTQLRELIQQAMPSLEVIKPPGVTIRTEVDREVAGVSLGPERAVGLAMAIYEVCCNAIVHGLGASGTVTIRARLAHGESRVALDVIDDGTRARVSGVGQLNGNGNGHENGGGNGRGQDAGDTDVPEARSGRGFGLELVRGLVSRELHGTFTMDSRPGGGTTATIEFPLAVSQEPESAII